jgi:hypothetical protein
MRIYEKDLNRISTQGNGTKSRPYIIDSLGMIKDAGDLNKKLQIYQSDAYFELRNIDFASLQLGLYYCSHVQIEGCSFEFEYKGLEIGSSHHISIKNCKIKTECGLIRSFEVMMENCDINLLYLHRSYQNKVKGGSIDELSIEMSRGNVFEQVFIPKEYTKPKKLNSSFLKYKILRILPFALIIGAICYVGYLSFSFGDYFLLILTTIIASIILIICMVPMMYIMRKSKEREKGKFSIRDLEKYPPNKVI